MGANCLIASPSLRVRSQDRKAMSLKVIQFKFRWHNHLNPHIVKKSWTKAEEDVLFEEHKRHGNKWTIIADKLPGRTDNSIKNHFYSTVRKSLRRISKFMGSKNSTAKMRQIKPSTLSKIFNLA